MLYHNRTPAITAEVKIDLPVLLSSTYHVLFSVFHIRCTPKKPVEQVTFGNVADAEGRSAHSCSARARGNERGGGSEPGTRRRHLVAAVGR